jgi:hypothetical protein
MNTESRQYRVTESQFADVRRELGEHDAIRTDVANGRG